MKKWLILLSSFCSLLMLSACQTTTTTTLEATLTGTIFIQMQKVYDHFTTLDFTEFSLESAMVLIDATATPPLYFSASSPNTDIVAACASVIDNFTYNGLFPWANSEEVFQAVVIFSKGDERISFRIKRGDYETILISHSVDGVELYGGTFPGTSYPIQMATLLTLLSIETSV